MLIGIDWAVGGLDLHSTRAYRIVHNIVDNRPQYRMSDNIYYGKYHANPLINNTTPNSTYAVLHSSGWDRGKYNAMVRKLAQNRALRGPGVGVKAPLFSGGFGLYPAPTRGYH